MRRIYPRIDQRRPELSQHFLRNATVARRIVDRMALSPGDLIIEPGAGDGMLTQALTDAGCRVVAVERDERLFALLKQRFARHPNVRCEHGDFLAFPLPSTPYRVLSNVPYAITAALVRKLLHAARPPDEALLIVQREAAQKFSGTPRETLFSLLHKPWFAIEIVASVQRRDFSPPPRVHSALLSIRHRDVPLVAGGSGPVYRSFISGAFGHGAPEVSHALRRYLTPRQVYRLGRDLGFARDARASQLTFDQWLGIFRFVEHECLGHDPTLMLVHHTPRCVRGTEVARAEQPVLRPHLESAGPQRSIFFGAAEGWRRKLWISQRLNPSADSTSSMRARLVLSSASCKRRAYVATAA